MEEKMNKLENILNEIKPEWITESCNEDSDYDFYVAWPSEVYKDQLESLCCDLFIREGGSVNHGNVIEFNNRCAGSFHVGPGERDSFGWLSGVVTTDHGCTFVHCFG